MQIYYLIIFLLIINYFFVKKFKKISLYIKLFDHPDKIRKLHKTKTSTIGGFIVYLNLTIFFFYYLIKTKYFNGGLNFFSYKELFIFFLFLSLFFFIGFIDDKYNLAANIKLFIFAVLLYFLFYFDNGLLINQIKFSFYEKPINIINISVFFSIFAFLLFLNAFNMFDGINLQSGIYSIFIFLMFLYKGIFLEISIIIILALIFFLYLNYKNKCFLGNNGSVLISFVIGYLFIKSAGLKAFHADEIFLVMLIPGLDLLRLCIKRILNKNHPFKADRNHVHHLLIKKFNLFKTNIFLFSIIFVFNIFSLIYKNTIYCILLSFVSYIFLIIKFEKN
jgi:UDP-GlcNAc:undecaprenyl-phosphate GlcNAc-1-phosphate transferase